MTDPVVLITGGAAGIGRAIAARVIAAGARAILWDVNAAVLGETLATLGPMAGGALLDVADAGAVARAGRALGRRPPTHLVNNAGIVGHKMALDAIDPVEVDRALAINVRGTLCVTSAFLKARAAHPTAAIVNIASIAGQNGGAPGHAVYGATKGALIALTSAMARDLAPGLRVNALAPGIIDTEIQRDVFAEAEAMQRMASNIPLHRIGTPDEVAEAALWLLFGAPYVTGEVIRVAGGR